MNEKRDKGRIEFEVYQASSCRIGEVVAPESKTLCLDLVMVEYEGLSQLNRRLSDLASSWPNRRRYYCRSREATVAELKRSP